MYAWEFEKGGRELKVRVDGQLVFNGTFQMLNAALAGFGLAYVPEDMAQPHLAKGRLKRVLEDWCLLFGLSPLLPQPPPVLGGLYLAGRCAAVPGLANKRATLPASVAGGAGAPPNHPINGHRRKLKETPQRRQRLFDAVSPFGHRLLGPIEFQQTDVAQSRH